MSPPILVAPWTREPLLLYIMAMPQVVSAVLMTERGEWVGEDQATPSPGGQDGEDRRAIVSEQDPAIAPVDDPLSGGEQPAASVGDEDDPK